MPSGDGAVRNTSLQAMCVPCTADSGGKENRKLIAGSRVRPCGFLVPLALDGKAKNICRTWPSDETPAGGVRPYFYQESGRVEKTENSITICGTLDSGEYAMPGDISSQFVSGMLYALPLLINDSGIYLTTKIESKPYIDLTRSVQKLFGIRSHWRGHIIDVSGRQGYRPHDMTIEGDYSTPLFLPLLQRSAGRFCCKGLEEDSDQGDREILGIFAVYGSRCRI